MREEVVLCLALFLFAAGCVSSPLGGPVLTSQQCADAGGEIVNSLGMESPQCPDGRAFLGEVEGLQCPCICCASS